MTRSGLPLVRTNSGDFRDDHAEIVARERLERRFAERHHIVDRRDVLDAGAARHRRQIGDAGGSVRVETQVESRLPLSKIKCTRLAGR
jgi:hypothetical protein